MINIIHLSHDPKNRASTNRNVFEDSRWVLLGETAIITGNPAAVEDKQLALYANVIRHNSPTEELLESLFLAERNLGGE